MKIKDNREKFVNFETLNHYDTFCYVGDFCMKIPTLHDGEAMTYNAFCFNNNNFTFYMPKMEVLPVNITLEVNN